MNVRVLCTHIAGVLNVKADQLSRRRQITSTEWSLHPVVVQALWERWGVPFVDLFATRENTKRPMFVSPYPDEKAWAVDALSIPWTGMWAYAFPPTPLIPKVLQQVRTSNVELIMIAPWWPRQAWAGDLGLLRQEDCRIQSHKPDIYGYYWFTDQAGYFRMCFRTLPLWPGLLKQPKVSVFHNNIGMLRLHAYRAGRVACRDFSGSGSESRQRETSLHFYSGLRFQVETLHAMVR